MTSILIILSIISLVKGGLYLKGIQDETSKISLNKCILKISSRLFTTDNGITVSLPSSEYSSRSISDSTRQLLSDIAKPMNWSLVIKTMKKQYQTAASFSKLRSVSNNFIIFLRDNVEKDMNLDIHSWYPLIARFIVTTLTVFDNASQVAEHIIQPLWKKNILKGIVLAPNFNNNEVFDIYKWYPFHGANCGRDAGNIKIIDQCLYGKFVRNTPLIQRNVLPKYFSGCTLVVGFVSEQPYIINMENNSVQTGDYIDTKHGLEVNLVNLVAKSMKLRALYIQSRGRGDILWNGTATGNLKLLADSKIDIAIGSYSVTESRSYFFDYTFPYKSDDLVWCVPHFMINTGDIGDINLGHVSLTIIIVLVAVLSVLICYSSKLLKEEDVKTPGDTFLCMAAVMTAASYSDKWKTSPTRLAFITAVILGFYLDTVFQTHLTSVLSSRSYNEKFGSVQDIKRHNLSFSFAPITKRYFEEAMFEDLRNKGEECYDYEECVRYVAVGRNTAFCGSKVIVESISKNLVSSKNEPLVFCFGKIVILSKSMLMEKGSYLFYSVDGLMGKIQAAGLIAKWERDVKNLGKRKEIFDSDVGSEEDNLLTFTHLLPAFKLLGFLHCVSFLVLGLEIVFYRCHSRFTE